jgi:sortase A
MSSHNRFQWAEALRARLARSPRRAAPGAPGPAGPGGAWVSVPGAGVAGAGGSGGSGLAGVADPEARSWRRRIISVVSIALVVGGVAVIGYPFLTNLWQDRLQAKLGRQLVSRQLADAYRAHKVATGDSLTRIKIPALGVDMVVVQGTTESALQAGAGHYESTPLPCEAGNVAIAGHRTTYGKPFANLDKLQPGDTIELDTPLGGCVYHVAQAPYVVAPTDISVLAATSVQSLTLTTCNPKGSAAQRLVVRAVWSQELKPL